MARQVLPIIGAAVGAYFGGAQGAQIGWAIGSMVGNAVDPQVIKGPQIGDLAQQTSQEGVPRPIVFGLSPPMAGNIVACGDPVIKNKKQKAGKGGGPVTETQQVFRTYAIGVCEGPINDWLRVWRNGTLVYDVRPGSTIDPAQNAKFLQTARFFMGTYTQNASPALQVQFGIGTTPVMRGTAYMVMENEDLTDLRGAVPQYSFQVLRCEGTVLTSRPYPIDEMDQINSSAAPFSGRALQQPFLFDYSTSNVEARSGSLRQIVRSYDIPPDYTTSDAEAMSGDLFHDAIDYAMPPEDFLQSDAEARSGDLFISAQHYDIPADTMTSDTTPQSGTIE